MTDAQARALTILREHGPMMPREFAERMWPDSPGWERVHRCGYGATKGRMMAMSGGAYLGKLHKRGLVRIVTKRWLPGFMWTISPKGLAALNDR